MKQFNKKNNFKNILRLALIVVLILILGFMFYNTWINYYNIILKNPYILKGSIFLMCIYMILLYFFMLIYDCNNISFNKLTAIIFTESLAVISCNILVYFVMIIPTVANDFVPIYPIIILSFKNIIAIVIWSVIVINIFHKLFPPLPMLFITNNQNIDKEILNIYNKSNFFDIEETICYKNNRELVIEKCNNYKSIIIGDITSEDRNDIIKHCFNNLRDIYVIPKLSDILLKYSDEIYSFDTPIFLSAKFELSFEKKIFKRLFDIICSIIVLVCFLPLWLIFALLIYIEDKGNVFYFQERITQDGKKFNIVKFRSMKINANDIKVLPTINNDPRITKIGKFIRKFHIDEVPQFINVLKGEMSVVGPRPERKEHVELYSKQIKEFEYRHKVKAGITGLAQIYGRYNSTAIDKLKLDLIYIKKYSLMFDIELLFRTIKAIFISDTNDGFDNDSQKYISENAK